MSIHLVTFTSSEMSRSADLCIESGLRFGCNDYDRLNHSSFKRHDFYKEHEVLLSQPRGCGFWAWKPYLIQHALDFGQENTYVIYADAGVEFLHSVNYIIDRVDQDIFLFGNQYEHAHWCKRDIVDAVWSMLPASGVDQGRSASWSRFGKQVQASVIFFRVNDKTRAFVKEWLDWCLFEGGRLIDDSPSRNPNHPEFQENRHDQAILTTMAYRDGIKLHWWPAQYNDGAFEYPRGDYPDEGYPCLFSHHRKRNHEWAIAV